MTVYFHGTADKLALGNVRRCASPGELLEVADIVSLHVDGWPGNRGLFGAAELARMRQGGLFLNLSRGFVVDQAALRSHLESGHLSGGAVDVYPAEPKARGGEFDCELRGLPNVILTPHIGGSTEDAQRGIGRFVAQKLVDFVATGSTAMSVNLPNLSLPERAGAHISSTEPSRCSTRSDKSSIISVAISPVVFPSASAIAHAVNWLSVYGDDSARMPPGSTISLIDCPACSIIPNSVRVPAELTSGIPGVS
jgi:hypothetical protein